MLIGEDFPKIEIDWMGFHLMEPNTFIDDVIIMLVSFYFSFQLFKLYRKNGTGFSFNWAIFFVLFALSFFLGGLGHLFFYYWGVNGKYPSWVFSILAVFFIEKAMISIYPVVNKRTLFNQLSRIKLVLAIAAFLTISFMGVIAENPNRGLLIPTINSFIGLVVCLGILGRKYQKELFYAFKYLWWSVLVLFPASLFQVFKVNLHPWFDKNNMSHILLISSIVLYYIAVKKFVQKSN